MYYSLYIVNYDKCTLEINTYYSPCVIDTNKLAQRKTVMILIQKVKHT